LDQAHNDGRSLTSQLAAGEQPRRAPHRPGPQQVLEVVVVAADLAVMQEATERPPAVEAVGDRAGDATAVWHPLALALQPGLQFVPM
jgi:hypothetical protein